MKNKVLITTAIDYANAVIHIGHAYEKLLADTLARFERIRRGSENVHYTTGTDEHGTTCEKAAAESGRLPIDHVADISEKDKIQIDSLNISYDRFIRTTDQDHEEFSAQFFKRAFENGDIYKANYVGYYCEGCEAHKTLSELDESSQCKYHPTKKIQELNEENYFFKWSKYEDFLKSLIESNKLMIKPEGKRAEMLAFLENGLKDITVSRPKYKVSWGITTPIDSEQVIYVWFDALINYLTEGLALGFWDENTKIVHFVGKDIARWHTLLWPAMLKSAGYRLPDEVYVHGFINLNGEKISKSTGNVLYPADLVKEYGVDAVRYYLLKYGPITEDSNITLGHLKDVYNGELANGLGNTVARVSKMAERSEFKFSPLHKTIEKALLENITDDVFAPIDDYRTDLVLVNIWKKITELDKHINKKEPWSITDKAELQKVLSFEVSELRKIAALLLPFLPNTANKIWDQFGKETIKSTVALFPRI